MKDKYPPLKKADERTGEYSSQKRAREALASFEGMRGKVARSVAYRNGFIYSCWTVL